MSASELIPVPKYVLTTESAPMMRLQTVPVPKSGSLLVLWHEQRPEQHQEPAMKPMSGPQLERRPVAVGMGPGLKQASKLEPGPASEAGQASLPVSVSASAAVSVSLSVMGLGQSMGPALE